jgi:hypothetical protein
VLQFLVQNVFQIVNHFYQSHLNRIHNWDELIHLHFMNHRLNQFWFQTVLNFLDQNVFQIVNHFH